MKLQRYIYLKQCPLHDNPLPTWENACMNTNSNVPIWERNAVEEYIAG